MSIWKELKKVVNSNFNKTLDVQMAEQANATNIHTTEQANIIKEMIINQARMTRTGDVYCNFDDAKVSVKNEGKGVEKASLEYPMKLKMTRSGLATLSGDLDRSDVNNTKGAMYIYKNGVKIFEWAKSFSSGSDVEHFAADISFERGDIFSLKLHVENYVESETSGFTASLTLQNFSLLGSVKHDVFEVV